MPFSRRHPKADCNRLWRSRSPVSRDRSYLLHDPRNRSREPSPVSRDRSYALHDPRKRSREPSPVSSEISYALHDPRNRSREPSPVSSESSYALHDPRSRSREPSLASIESSFVLHDTRRRSRERSPVRFARGSRTEHGRAAVQMYNEYRRPSGQHVCSQFRSDTFPGYGAFLSYGERRSTRDRNEFVHRQYNCMAAGTEWKRRRDWNGKMVWPPQRNPNFRQTDNFSSTNTVDNSNAPLSPVVCSYYNSMKTCEKGDSCKFIHLCRYFIENNCKYKQVCKRSHNIFDWQPKRLLQKYDLIPNDNLLIRSSELDIITSVKEELRKGKSIPSETTPQTLNRPLLDEESYLERAKLSPAETDTQSNREREGGSICEPITSPDWSDVNQSDDAEEQVEKAEDFIPLETKSKTEKNDKKDKSKKRRKRKSDKKASMGKRNGDAIKLEPVEENWSDADDTDVDLSITFEYHHPERRFLVKQMKNKWQISNIDGEWKELSFVESEVFNRLSDKGLEIADKALSKY